jgi:hypothetical protein
MYIVKLKELTLTYLAEDTLTVKQWNNAKDMCIRATNTSGFVKQVVAPTLEEAKAKLAGLLTGEIVSRNFPPGVFEYSFLWVEVDADGCFWEPRNQKSYNNL